METIENLSIRVTSDDIFGPAIQVRAYSKSDLMMAEPITFRKVEPGSMCTPFMALTRDQAQQLVDSLWDTGIRPTLAAESSGELSAVKNHLADMRVIANTAVRGIVPKAGPSDARLKDARARREAARNLNG